MLQVLDTYLRSLYPMMLFSLEDIERLFPLTIKRSSADTQKARALLKQRMRWFDASGDQSECAPLAYFGFRWIATTNTQTPPLPHFARPMDVRQLACVFPELSYKLHQLDGWIIAPDDLHEFLVGMMAWEPPAIKIRKDVGKAKLQMCSTTQPWFKGKGVRCGVVA